MNRNMLIIVNISGTNDFEAFFIFANADLIIRCLAEIELFLLLLYLVITVKRDKQMSLREHEHLYFFQNPIDIRPYPVLHLICQTTLV